MMEVITPRARAISGRDGLGECDGESIEIITPKARQQQNSRRKEEGQKQAVFNLPLQGGYVILAWRAFMISSLFLGTTPFAMG